MARLLNFWREWAFSAFIAVIGIGAATPVLWALKDRLGEGDAALLYLPVVTLIAVLDGVKSGVIAAPIAFVVGGYLFVPSGDSLYGFGTKDYTSLAVFLIIGLAMGWQTGRMREREAEAISRERETALLYRLSGRLSSPISSSEMAMTLLSEILSVADSAEAALFIPDDADVLKEYKSRDGDDAAPSTYDKDRVQEVYGSGEPFGLKALLRQKNAQPSLPTALRWKFVAWLRGPEAETDEDIYLPLRGKDRTEGVLFMRAPSERSFGIQDERMLVSVSYLAGSFIENQRLKRRVARTEALEEADRLKTTLISSVSHELKTPLASVTATVTHLLANDLEWDPPTFRSDLETAAKDLERLNGSIGSLLDLSRLESGSWHPNLDWIELGETLGSARSRIDRSQRSRLLIKIPDDLPSIYGDYQQIVRALLHLMENALEYSPPETPVRVGADRDGETLRIWVEDQGPGVPAHERELIFQKFYRGESSYAAPSGTGLGLAIAREIIHGHGGSIRVEDATPSGARFIVQLPLKEVSHADPREDLSHPGGG
jgi:two-component system sensor histidine kinase KdpD